MRARLLVPLLALVMTQLACADKEDTLTREESMQLVTHVNASALQALAGAQTAPSSNPQAAPTTYSGNFSGSHACPLGGTVSASGDFDGWYETVDSVYSAEVNYNLVLGFTDCAVQAENVTVTVNGKPNLTYNGSATVDGDTWTYNFSEVGGLSFETSDGRSGSCDIAYTYTASYDGQTTTIDYQANVCGNTFNIHVTN